MNGAYLWLVMPAVVMMLGGLLTARWHPTKQLIVMVQHLAAGIILAALTIEVFPEMRGSQISPVALIASFSVGVLFMYGVKLLGEHFESRSKAANGSKWAGLNYGFILTVFIDAALDGVTIGAGFAAGQKVGFALALGLSLEMLFLGMSLVSDTLKGSRMIWLSGALSLTLLLTASIGYHLLSRSTEATIALALSFSAAALLYLVTEELLIEAHRHEEERPYSMLVLFAGFVGFWLISLI